MLAVLTYIGAIVVSNMSVATFGPAVTPINAFFLIGLDLALRDTLHTRWSNRGLVWKMGALIVTASAISYALNPATGKIALASVLAFGLANTVDALIFHFLRDSKYLLRSNASNIGGAAVDSLVFPTVAFGAIMPLIVLAQFAAKVGGGFLWSLLLNRRQTATV